MNIFKTCTACMGGFWLWVWSRNVCLECSEERQSRSWKDKFVWVTVEALRNSGLALRDKEDWVHLTLILPSLPPSLYPQFYSALNIWHTVVCLHLSISRLDVKKNQIIKFIFCYQVLLTKLKYRSILLN